MTGQHRLAAWRGRRKHNVGAVLALVVTATIAVTALPSAAAPGDETLTVDLTQTTGTGPFDGDDAAGHDSGADNDVVRTNDTVTYKVGVRYEGGDQTNPTIEFTLPQGQELVSLPPFCLSGSSVTPATLPEPEVPLTGTSYQSLPTQTVVCRVENQAQGTALNYDFVAKVRPEMPNGTAMGPVVATATSDQVTSPASSGPVSQTVSAKANFDLSKRGTSTAENTGPMYARTKPCSFDASRSCRVVQYPMTISAASGGKGSSPLASPITFTDDISPATYYGATVWAAAVAAAGSEAAAIEKYAPRYQCGGTNDLWGSIPWSSAGDTTNSVRDSGAVDCDQPGGTGTPVNVTITDADTSAYTVPTKSGSGNALPADTGYVISRQMNLEIPLDAIFDLGELGGDGSTWTLATENTYTDVVMTDIGGNANSGEVVANNNRKAVISLQRGEGFSKFFSGIYGAPGNTPRGEFYSQYGGWEGPPGSGTVRDGNTVVVPGQVVQSNLFFSSTNGIPNSGTTYSRSYVGCDVWDDSKLGLTPGNYPGSGGTSDRGNDGSSPAWISNFNSTPTGDAPLSDLLNLKIEYSSGPAGAGSDSDCSTGTWYANPGDVPGATLVDGVYSGVNRVRVSFTSSYETSSDFFYVNLAIAQTVRTGVGTTGDVIPNWGSYKRAEGVHTVDETLADGGMAYDTSEYVPATHVGAPGDRLTLGAVTARIKKYVKNPSTGDFTDSAVPQYTAGSNVDYRLNPTITADVSAGTQAPVIVEDCLPKYQQFVSSTREGSGDPITPVIVQQGSPAGAELQCAAGETYVKWDLGLNTVNQAIDPIVYTVEILDTVRNGNYINNVLVSSEQDPSDATARDDSAQIQIVTPTGIKIAKSTQQSVVEVNPAGVASPRKLHWTVDFANVDAPQNVADVDVIDVLPSDGLSGSDFTGTLAFDSATVSAGTGISVLYTKVPAASLSLDPADATNGSAGATVWCDAPSGGAVVSGAGTAADCPSSSEQVTGLRFLRPGAFTPDDAFSVDITMTPADNAGGDVYNNRTEGRADGVSQGVGPASRAITIIESSIGDYVWLDTDKDGVQGAGEQGIPGFVVHLTGTDLDGNPVSATTTTDADGHYLFDGLASGTYTITFDPASLEASQAFTVQEAGGDDAADSDGDVTTGVVSGITLAPDTALLDVDQGVVEEPITPRPTYVTTVSDKATRIGDQVFDRVEVSGLVGGASVPMHWELFGPYRTRSDMTCKPGKVYAKGTITVTANGTVRTPKVKLTKAGFYTYVQSNRATADYQAQRTACGLAAETTKVAPRVEPTVRTVSSSQAVRVGTRVTDVVTIKGIPRGTKAKVVGHLYGPFESERSIRCTPAHAYRKVAFTAVGTALDKRSYRTGKVRVGEPGWYSWSMSVQGTNTTLPATEGCGKAKETLLATRPVSPTPPEIPTGFSGGATSELRTSDSDPAAGVDEATVGEVFGDDDLDFLEQVAQLIDIADGVEDGNVPAGDAGELPVVTEAQADELAATINAEGSTVTQPPAAIEPRHVKQLYSPPKGRGVVRKSGATLRVPSIGVRAALDSSRVVGNTMAVPQDVRRVGWLNRSAHFGDLIGSTVVAGHVSDEHDSPGALYRLKSVERGDIITVTKDGKTYRYRVTTLRTYSRERHLPASIFSVTGGNRLNLVTCTGKVVYPDGRFHYTRNLVVTADAI